VGALRRRERVITAGRPLDHAAMQEIRRVMELRHHKWDAQVGDVATLAPFPLLLRSTVWNELSALAQRLFHETLAVERELLERPELQARLGLPRPLRRLFAIGRPTPAAARVMRFDFHPTTDGWRISEVNSDVPGGFTEATHFTALMAEHASGARRPGDPTRAIVEALSRPLGRPATVALTNAPGHMEDHQVVAHLAAALRGAGLTTEIISLGQLQWRDGRAELPKGPVDAIVRFFQAEWLAPTPAARLLFVDGRTPVLNPGVAALSESKRLPLLWDDLHASLDTWRALLPETRSLADAPWASDDGWLIKSAYSNTGDTVSIRAALPPLEWARRSWSARLRPSQWVAQRRFSVVPVDNDDGPWHPCIGVYVVDAAAAGAYARVTRKAIIDYSARDAAVLIFDGP
jgi:glutathionylspermidine synthase